MNKIIKLVFRFAQTSIAVLILFCNTSFALESRPEVLRRSNANQKSMKIADQALEDKLDIGLNFKTYQIPNGITWNENPYRSETWCFYFQSMDTIGDLVNAFELTKNEAYLRKAADWIDLWIKENNSIIKFPKWLIENVFYLSTYVKNSYRCQVWDEHSVANRVVNMIQFLESYKKSTIFDHVLFDKIVSMLQQHGKFLANSIFYNSNNHGIFEDRALIALAVFYGSDPKWYETALNRLMKHARTDVSVAGVHLEHSPSYHLIVLTLLKDVLLFVKENDVRRIELIGIIDRMEDYWAHVVGTQQLIPNIGDSSPGKMSPTAIQNISNPHLEYAMSKGLAGTVPFVDGVFQDDGVAIFRNSWTIKPFIFFMLTSAFNSRVHKHADDLSFVLAVDGEDFLVDSGKYNYVENDPYRKYFRSALAHNAIVVDGKSYDLKKSQIGKSRIESHRSTQQYGYVKASHDLYKSVHIQRSIVFLRKGIFLIQDLVKSTDAHRYSQLFQISERVAMTNDGKSATLNGSQNNKAQIYSLVPDAVFKSVTGSTNPIQGWASKSFNGKFPVSTVSYELSGTNATFKTVIDVNRKNNVVNFAIDDTEFHVEYGDGEKEKFSLLKD